MKTGVLVIMAFKYTEEQLNKLDKELLISLFLGMQDQMEELTKQTEALNEKMQLMMEQLILSKKNRFGMQILPERYAYSEISGTSILI